MTDYDFVLCEIGGTVGDIEAMPFMEAIRQLGNDLPRGNAVYVHLTLMPYIPAAGELKTKPTQHSVKELRSIGIAPDILLVRADRDIPESERKKLSLFCNVRESAVIQALDVKRHIYDVPKAYHDEGLDEEVLAAFGIEPAPQPRMATWEDVSDRVHNPEGEVTIAIVGKYTGLKDAYKSLIEALHHGGMANRVKVNLEWIESEVFESEDPATYLENVHGILVPGGFGERGAEGKIAAATFARERKVPYFGICFGMQMACIEAARSLAGIEKRVIDRIRPVQGAGRRPDDRMAEGQHARKAHPGRRSRRHDAPRRLQGRAEGRHPDRRHLRRDDISERHRHRYEVNIDYRERLEDCGLVFSGLSPDGVLPETIEYADHPWFIGVQYHPELKSRPFEPHPLFRSFIEAALEQSRLV
jgi:CTP synthase